MAEKRSRMMCLRFRRNHPLYKEDNLLVFHPDGAEITRETTGHPTRRVILEMPAADYARDVLDAIDVHGWEGEYGYEMAEGESWDLTILYTDGTLRMSRGFVECPPEYDELVDLMGMLATSGDQVPVIA